VVVGLDPAAMAALAAADIEPDQWSGLFAVYTRAAERNGLLPILGKYRVAAGVLQFEPRFPLEPDVAYRARFDASKLPTARGADGPRSVVEAEFVVPRKYPATATRVLEVYPSGDKVPENLLKFYLHFTAPMSRGLAFAHIHLLDEAGRDVAFPFVTAAGELWDPRGVRLTLLFDPGRLKTGLKPREEFGPILRQGGTYRLVVDAGWLDAQGLPLAAGIQKTFQVGPPDDQQPAVATWKVQAPGAGTRQPLTLTFPEPLDHALLVRVLAVHGSDGRSVPGVVTIAAGETLWRFTPESAWQPGSYSVIVDKDLEDLAGNSVGRPFEVDVFNKIDRTPVPETVAIPFQIGPPAP
jgi:hypothetical protein